MVPESLNALGYRLDDLQNKADWAAAVALGNELEAISVANPLMQLNYAALLSLLRAELLFSRAMLEHNARNLDTHLPNDEID